MCIWYLVLFSMKEALDSDLTVLHVSYWTDILNCWTYHVELSRNVLPSAKALFIIIIITRRESGGLGVWLEGLLSKGIRPGLETIQLRAVAVGESCSEWKVGLPWWLSIQVGVYRPTWGSWAYRPWPIYKKGICCLFRFRRTLSATEAEKPSLKLGFFIYINYLSSVTNNEVKGRKRVKKTDMIFPKDRARSWEIMFLELKEIKKIETSYI